MWKLNDTSLFSGNVNKPHFPIFFKPRMLLSGTQWRFSFVVLKTLTFLFDFILSSCGLCEVQSGQYLFIPQPKHEPWKWLYFIKRNDKNSQTVWKTHTAGSEMKESAEFLCLPNQEDRVWIKWGGQGLNESTQEGIAVTTQRWHCAQRGYWLTW